MALEFSPPIHPGEVLREQFLEPLGLSAGALAREIGVPRTRIERIVKEEMGVSADTALRLAKFFDTTPKVWMNLQQNYELALGAKALKRELSSIRPRKAA
jgi:addiction module HigA family antidote